MQASSGLSTMVSRARTKVTVKPRNINVVATELHNPNGVIARDVWNKTQKVAALARRKAPVKTGALRRSIVARKDMAASTPARPVYEVTAGEGLRYAAPQELGFRHWRSGRFIPGKHFLRDAHNEIWR